MFREMRRSRQQLDNKQAVELLNKATSGVLAVSGDEGYPYAVPLSFVYSDGVIYFHCAKSGHKLDAIRNEPKASFCVIAEDDVKGEEYTTYYKSVIVFGKAYEVTEPDEIYRSAAMLAEKYYPMGSPESCDAEIRKYINSLNIVKIQIEHMTGKQAKELIGK